MPYSEGIGFIADLRDPEDIDMVFYVVAHESGTSMVGASSGGSQYARSHRFVGDAGPVHGADGNGAPIRTGYDAQILAIRNGSLLAEPRK
jgi:hypothetical protein